MRIKLNPPFVHLLGIARTYEFQGLSFPLLSWLLFTPYYYEFALWLCIIMYTTYLKFEYITICNTIHIYTYYMHVACSRGVQIS
jgi:hypothetical protein